MCILGSILLFLAEIVEIDVAEAGTKNNEICSLLSNCFLHLLHLFAFCWYTGDNVRLSDVVKFMSGCSFDMSVVKGTPGIMMSDVWGLMTR